MGKKLIDCDSCGLRPATSLSAGAGYHKCSGFGASDKGVGGDESG